MIKKVKALVFALLQNDNSGHGKDHVLRVYNLSIKFARAEKANENIVALAALLHDADDYKIFGKQSSENLPNAKRIMNEAEIEEKTQKEVLEIIETMGYRKYLKGIRPNTIEGKIVSDADMCDAIGTNGIIRSIVYAVSDKGNGRIFDKNIYPNSDITSEEYNSNGTTHDTDGAINHFFEKLLKLKSIMMTNAGKEEATKRQMIMIEFLNHFFEEENVPEWKEYLEKYLEEL